jgi:hypothetical protein
MSGDVEPIGPHAQMEQLNASVSSPAFLQLQLKGESPPHQDQSRTGAGDKAGDWGTNQVGATIKVHDTCERVQEERQLRQRAPDDFSECRELLEVRIAAEEKARECARLLPEPLTTTALSSLQKGIIIGGAKRGGEDDRDRDRQLSQAGAHKQALRARRHCDGQVLLGVQIRAANALCRAGAGGRGGV